MLPPATRGSRRPPDPATPASAPVAPPPGATDPVVARWDGGEVRASELAAWFFTTHRREAYAALSKLVGLRIVEAEARKLGLRCPEEPLVLARAEVLAGLGRDAAVAYGIGTPPERYVERRFHESLEKHLDRRMEEERERWLFSRIIRYHAILTDQVELQVIVCREQKTAREIEEKLGQGADFGRLAGEHSIHESRGAAGRMPPLPREALSPAVSAAVLGLGDGARSGVLTIDAGGGATQYEIVRLLRRLPGRAGAAYAEVREEIERGLRERPVDAFEWQAWFLRLERLYNVDVSDMVGPRP